MKYTKKQTTLFAILVLLIFVILVSFFMVRFKGKSSQFSQEVIETLMAENEDNPESVKYLVTDNCISRVYPETKIETFVTNFSEGEVVKVYSDKDCTQEVTDGFVMSGMYAKYDENDRIFEISVLGDINEKTSKTEENKVLNGDGILNQIELTRDIREAIDDEDWKIVDETEKKSADVNCNNEIDEKAVKSIINYIVFGDLNIPEVNIVEKPSIEVIDGKLNSNTVYISDVTIKITENDEDALETIYKITGDKQQDYKTALNGEEVVLSDNGMYKITAYTYGKLGNKSKREYALINIDKTANYTMEYYLENTNGEYEKVEDDTKVIEGIIGETVQIEDKIYTDYELDVDNKLGNLRGEVLEDGSLVLKAYYERKSFTCTLTSGENIESISVKGNGSEEKIGINVSITGKWGEKITIDAKVKQQDGYKIEWKNWENTDNSEDTIKDQNSILIIQNQNIEYEAIATKEIIDYHITYNLQNGNLADGVTNPEKYNIETPSITLNNPSKQGYIFEGWTGGVIDENGEIDNTAKTGTTQNTNTPTPTLTLESGSIGNRRYTANWKPIENTPYTVKHYKEKLQSGEFELAETENKEGTTDTEVSAIIKNYNGFSFDENNENNVLKGNITADGNLILELYYTRNIYNLTITAGDNISSVSAEGEELVNNSQEGNELNAQETTQITEGKQTTENTITLKYKYEQKVTIDAIMNQVEGYNYTWSQWMSSDISLISNITEKSKEISMPAGDIILTATADRIAKIYNITYELNGGTLPQGVENPVTYTIESSALTINNLQDGTKLGYNFAGWTGSNGNVPSKNVVLKSGSTGDKEYIANWEEADFQYTVEYYYDNVKDEDKTETKIAKYNSVINTYEDKCITGYELKEQPESITISHDESKNVLKVYYIRKMYTLTLEKDENIESVIGNGTYKYGEEVQINATLKNEQGYTITWNNWNSKTPELIENNINQTATIIIPAGNIVLQATTNKVANEYSIQYMLNGGNVTLPNPSTYTIETENFTLNNPQKQGYVFDGWTGGTQEQNTGTSGNITVPTTTVTIEKGSIGDRVYTANWVGDSKTKYVVKHYKEKLDGTFELADTDELEGTTDSTVIAVKKVYKGFSFDENNSNNLIEGIVAPDGSLVLSVYYKRNEYTLQLIAGSNISSVSLEGQIGTQVEAKYKFGTQINISAVIEQQTGYTITWGTWESNNSEILVNQPLQNALIGMPIGDITLTAKATKTINTYNYKIQYYYDNVIDETKTEEKLANFGSTISSYTNKNIIGYELDKEENKPLVITENQDNNIMKVYYKQTIYTISYNLNEGELQEGKTNPEEYKVKTENFTLNNPQKIGYTFLGWTGTNGNEPQITVTIEKGSTGNREYTANWRANTDTDYTVEHYKENLDGTYSKVEEDTEYLVGTTGETVTATPKNYIGFTYDENTENTIKSGIVAGDGSLILKLYYTRNSYELKLTAGDNIESVKINKIGGIEVEETESSAVTTITKSIKYEQIVEVTATTKIETNYNIFWDKWESSSIELLANQSNQTSQITMPAGNIELTAKATKIGKDYNYTIEYYYDNVIDSAKTETKTEKYNTQITTYPEKLVLGYEFDKVEGTPLTITENEETNKIKVYYKIINYNISYDLQEGSIDTDVSNPTTYTIKTEDFVLNNPNKIGYDFLGWTGGVLGNNGEISDTAQTGTTGNTVDETKMLTIQKGSIGDRKYTANWRPSTDTVYKIEHYIENINSTEEDGKDVNIENYTLYKTEGIDNSLVGTTGETVTSTPISITGFTYNEEKSAKTISGTILPDGSLVLKIFYTRNTYKLNLVVGENVKTVINKDESSTTSIEKTYKYDESVQIGATLAKITGYTTNWKNWTSSNTDLISNIDIANTTIKIPAGDITLTANGQKQKANFLYTVKYYYDGIEDETAKESGKTAEYESQIISYTDKIKDGYIFDKAENLPLTITANPDENVINIYYKLEEYTIDYDLKDGILEDGVTNPVIYNVKTENMLLNNPTKEGYIFKGWTGGVVNETGEIDSEVNTGTSGNVTVPTKNLTIEKGSLGNRKYTANWQERFYEVIVHHYLQGTGPEYNNDPVVVAEEEIFTSKVLGDTYTTDDLIPTYDENGNIIETDERNYLDGEDLYVTGNSGNVTGVYTKETINVIYYYQYYPVIRIVSSPAEELNGTEYVTIKDAIEALESKGLTSQSEISKLEILRNVKNESVVIENKNVQINLAGFTVNSKSETEPTIKLDNSKLIVTDESALELGKIVSENSSGVYVKTNSEFTLGVEAKPVKQTPEIIGNTIGVEKEIIDDNQGIFNFFDGTITGKIAILGKVDLTPVLYNATVAPNENEDQVAKLAIVSGIEVRIGRKLYTKIEDAINDANTVIGTDGSQVEIVVVQDLSKAEPIVVDETKNIKLDLDGHKITTTAANYVLKNYGTLEIVDSTANNDNLAGTGSIVSTTESTIYNDATGTLTIRAGTIGLEKDGKNAIVNNGELYIGTASETENQNELMVANESEETNNVRPYFYSNVQTSKLVYGGGNVTIENGEFSANGTYSYGISTYGNTIINGGTFNAFQAAIVQTSSATSDKVTKINGGTFNATNWSIKQEGNGKFIINNGCFNNEILAYTSLQINNGTFKGGFDVSGGNLEINNGICDGSISTRNNGIVTINNGIFNGGIGNGNGPFNINGGTINSSINNYSGTMNINNATINYTKGIAIQNSATMYINNGTTVTTTTNSPIKNEGTLFVKQCTINCEAAYYGISNSGKLVLGDNDGEISNEYPLINSTYGISNIGGTFNFYDGKIISNIDSTIRGNVNEVPENCEVLINKENGKEIATVGIPTDPVAKIGDTTYGTLQNAVDAVPANSTNTKIELLKNIYLSKSVTIPENKNITLDVKQYTIKGLNSGYVFNNSGTLELNSTTESTLPDLSFVNKVDKSDYYFIEQDGALVSNNKGVQNTTANSYIPIDLTNLSGKFELKVNAKISSEIKGDFAYATITKTTSIPAYNTSSGRFIYETGNIPAEDYTTTLTGGEMYYLHFGYYKNSSINSYNDEFVINNISIYPKGKIISYAKHSLINNTNKLVLNRMDISLNAEGTSSSYVFAIENTGELEINSGTINIATNGYTRNIYNKDSGSVVINGGYIYNSSAYCIENASTNNITINGGFISGSYGIYNSSTGDIVINDGILSVNETSGRGIYNKNGDGTVTINNGYIKGLEAIVVMDAGKLIMNNGVMQEVSYNNIGYGAIELSDTSSFEMYNGRIYSRWGAIKTNASTQKIVIHDGSITSENSNALINKGILEITNGKLYSNTNNATALENSGTANIENAYIQGGRGITNSGTMTILNGQIYANSEIGIYNTSKLTIGTKDLNVNKEAPYIYGKTYGINSASGTFNFYDGKIEGASNQSISGAVTEIEEEYEIIKTTVNSRETAILDRLPIAENVSTRKKYYTLQEAFDDCVDGTEEEVKISRNAIITGSVETATINSNKNIVLDLNGFEISAGNKNTILNKGKLTIKDGTTSQSGKLKNTAQELILLEESGELIFESGNLQETVNKNLITNNGTGNITINGGNIITYNSSAIINNGNDSGAGSITINGGTIKSTNSGHCIMMNSGNLIVNDGATIATSGSAIYVNGENCDITVNGGTVGTDWNCIYNDAACKNVKVIAGTLGRITNNNAGKIIVGSLDENASIPIATRIINTGTGDIIVNNVNINVSRGCVENSGGGIVTINNGYISRSYNNEYNTISNTQGTVNINGGQIISSNYTNGAVIRNGTDNKKCVLNINGGTIFSDNNSYNVNCIENSSNGEVNITSGTIRSSNGYGILNESGSLTIGSDDGNINNDSIKIIGTTYGVINYSVFNYYDGKIQGAINKSIYGTISKMPENMEIAYEKSTVEIASLGNENVVKIGDTYYNSLNDAINSCSDSSSESTTITLMKDTGIGGSNYKIISGQNIVLDLNGKRINQYGAISNSGNFEITDNSEVKLGVIDVSNRMINNNGVFKFSAGKIYSYMAKINESMTSLGTRTIINNYGNGSVEMTGGHIYNYMLAGGTSNIIYTSSTNNISLSGGTIEIDGRTEYYWYPQGRYCVNYNNTNTENISNIVWDGTNINVIGSRYYSTSYAININGNTKANVIINSGTINTDYAIWAQDNVSKYGTLTITGGDISSEIYGYYFDRVEISGGNITSAVKLYSANNIEINGGNISGNVQVSTSVLTINDGIITGDLNVSSGSLANTQVNGGTLGNVTLSSSNIATINGGSITGTLTISSSSANVTMLGGTINNQSGNGVNLSSGTFTLGIKDYPVDITVPSITSSAIGVNRTGGTFNFYDGIITGQTKPISGEVADMPELYTVQLDEEAKVATLGINATFEQVVSIDGTYYNSIHEAVRAAGTANTIIKLEKDNVLSNTLTIAENQNITLDLASYSIRIPDEEYCVINNGNLTIIDTVYTDVSSNEVSGIENYTGVTIQNNGTLVLGIEDEIVHTKVPSIIGKTYGIENNGTLSIFDGTVKGETDAIGGTQTIISIPDGYSYKVELEVVDDTTNRKVFVLCTSEDAS